MSNRGLVGCDVGKTRRLQPSRSVDVLTPGGMMLVLSLCQALAVAERLSVSVPGNRSVSGGTDLDIREGMRSSVLLCRFGSLAQ